MDQYEQMLRWGLTPGFQRMNAWGGTPAGSGLGVGTGMGTGMGTSTGLGTGTDLTMGMATPYSGPLGSAAAGASGIGGAGRPEFWSLDNWLGTKDRPGMGQVGLGVAGGLTGLYLGMKQYGLAKESLAENKRQFGLNWGAQQSQINTQLEDRQRARVAANPALYEGVDSYLTRHRI